MPSTDSVKPTDSSVPFFLEADSGSVISRLGVTATASLSTTNCRPSCNAPNGIVRSGSLSHHDKGGDTCRLQILFKGRHQPPMQCLRDRQVTL